MNRLFKVALVVLVVLLLIMPLLGTACSKEEVTPTSTPAPTSTQGATPTPTKGATPTPTKVATPTPTQGGLTTVEVSVGILNSLTGAYAAGGANVQRIIDLIIEDMNKTGFVVGNNLCKFKAIVGDYAYDSAKAVTVVRKHILQDQVKFELAIGSPGVLGAQDYTEAAGVILMEGAVGSNYISPKYPLSFNVAGAYENTMPLDIQYLANKYPTMKKIYCIQIDLDVTRTTWKNIALPVLQYFGYSIVGSEYYPYTTSDFYPIIDRILAAKPDIVIDSSSAVLAKQLRDRGFKGMIYNGGPVGSTYAQQLGGAPNTDLNFYTGQNEHSPTLPPAILDFIARYSSRYSDYPQGSSFYMFTVFYSLAQAMTLAGTYTDVQKIAKALESGTFTSPLGPIKFAGADIFGIGHMAGPPATLNEFINGVATEVQVAPAIDGQVLLAKVYAAVGKPQ